MASLPPWSSVPSSFDPAIHLHSEREGSPALPDPPLNTHSDDWEASELQKAELTAAKNNQRIVIQHRAWKLAEAFRSDEDHRTETPLKKRCKLDQLTPISLDQGSHYPPSSPTPATMPALSSPMVWPLTSSPPIARKPLLASPRKYNAQPIMMGGFIIDDDDDRDQEKVVDGAKNDYGNLVFENELTTGNTDDFAQLAQPDMRHEQRPERQLTPSCDDFEAEEMPVSFTQLYQNSSPGRLKKRFSVRTCSGKHFDISQQPTTTRKTFQQLVASRSSTEAGRAKRDFYGVEIHKLMDEAAKASEKTRNAVHKPASAAIETAHCSDDKLKETRTLLWTEKYRAKRYTDLVGDERTHRSVLRWLKGWDPIVFPGPTRPKTPSGVAPASADVQRHRKILLLTGPPGHGKTTLAHVCARQAGYTVMEINASDERGRDVVKGRIRETVGTENVNGATVRDARGRITRTGRPLCVVVDEVDGVFGGSGGGGEGGFISALIDLVVQDEKNSGPLGTSRSSANGKRRKHRDTFRLLRPIILICNDAYHPALRPLRQSSLAEIVHIRKPLLNQVIPRVRTIFELEGFPCDVDAVRRLCEAVWGTTSTREASFYGGNLEGDLRGVLVVAEWVASKLRASSPLSAQGRIRLSRRWLEQHILGGLLHGGGETRAVGRGGAKEAVERVFLDGAGFHDSGVSSSQDRVQAEAGSNVGVAEMRKRRAIQRLRELVESCGEVDRVVTDCFAVYPAHPYRDDSILSKPTMAYDWLHFHDAMSSKVFTEQEWELLPYLSQPVLAFHHLFSTPTRPTAWSSSTTATSQQRHGNEAEDEDDAEPLPFTGLRADYSAREAEKQNRTVLSSLHAAFPSHSLSRSFRSSEDIATELLPYLVRLVTPDVKPVIVGGGGDQRGIASVRKQSEREMVRRAVEVMSGVGITFDRCKVETDVAGVVGRPGTWVYRMEPPLDILATFQTASAIQAPQPTRYAVRQVLDQEYQKECIRQQNEAQQARYRAGGGVVSTNELDDLFARNGDDKENVTEKDAKSGASSHGNKRDFFGRVIVNDRLPSRASMDDNDEKSHQRKKRRRHKHTNSNDNHDHDNENNHEETEYEDEEEEEENKVWITYHEGFSNAVRKPISLEELMRDL